MPTFLRKLFERYARRLIIGTEEGIKQIPNKDRVKLMADNIYKDFKAAGIPDKMIKTEKDIKVFHNQISAIEEKSSKKWWDKRLQKPPESADVVQFPEEAITDWTKPRPIPDKNFIPMRADQYRDVFGKSPDLKKVKKTEAQIKSQIEKQNKKNIKKMKDRKEFSYKENLLKEIDNKIIKEMDMTEKELYAMSDDALDSLRRDADPIRMEEYFSIEPKEPLAAGGIAGMLRDGLFGGGPPGVHGRETGGGYSDRERHERRQNVEGPPGGGDPEMTYTAPPKSDLPEHFINTLIDKAKKTLKPTAIGFDERNLNFMVMKELLKRKKMNNPSLSLMANVNPYGFFNTDAYQTPYIDESETEPLSGGLMFNHPDFLGGNLSAAAVMDIKGDPRYQIMYQKSFADGGIAGMLGERTGYFTGALADTTRGKAMSPGTSADYEPGQGHRETRETRVAPPGAGTQTYTAPPKHFEQTGFLSDVRKANREKYLNILKKYPTDEFRKWQNFSYLEGDPSLITEEEQKILEPFGSQMWQDMAKEDPVKFFELYKGRSGSKSLGVAPRVGIIGDPDADRPKEYDWAKDGGRIGLQGGGIAGMLGEPAYQDDSHRVPFADGNGVADKEAENAMFAKRVRELMDDGYDMGEAVRQAMKEGYKQGGRVPYGGGGTGQPPITFTLQGGGRYGKNENIQDMGQTIPGLNQEQYGYGFNLGAEMKLPWNLSLTGDVGIGRGSTKTDYKGQPIGAMSGVGETKLGDQWNIGIKGKWPVDFNKWLMGKAEGGRVPLSKGKFLGEGLPAAIEWLRKKFGKDIIKKGSDLTRPTKVIEKEKTKKMFDDFTNKINTQEALTKGSKKMAGPIKNINKKSFDMQPDSTDHTSWFQQEKFFDPKALDMFGKKVPSNWIEVEKKAAQKLIDDLGPLGVSPNHPNYKHMKAIRQSAKDRLESIKVTEALGGNIQMHDWLRMNRENIKFSNYVRGKGDPVVKDELSEIKKTFTQKKSTADEIKKGVADVMKDTSEAGLARSIEVDNLKLEFPGITDDLINNILADKNPQRIAEVKATMKEALKMQEKGMGAEEIINIFKDMKRTKQASGGLAGMLGE